MSAFTTLTKSATLKRYHAIRNVSLALFLGICSKALSNATNSHSHQWSKCVEYHLYLIKIPSHKFDLETRNAEMRNGKWRNEEDSLQSLDWNGGIANSAKQGQKVSIY